MSIKKLIAELSRRENVPIDLQSEVVPLVRSMCGHENLEIYFWSKEFQEQILKGEIAHWDYPDNGTVKNVIDIDYPKNLGRDWQRMICAKELVHVLDPIDTRVMTDAAFDAFCEKLVLPPEFHDPVDGMQVWSDRLAVYQAVAILFPWACRELFSGPYKARKITADFIASTVDIPVRYVKLVMTDGWQQVHQILSD
jgi:hypothetical protein